MDFPPSRSIIRQPEFEQQLEALLVNIEEADDFTLGAESVLSVRPEMGMRASPNGSIWYLPMGLVRGQRVSLYYTFDEQTVYFLAILAFED